MPFCPNCRDEYDEGYAVCADCGASLVETLPEEPKDTPPDWDSAMDRIFLTSTSGPEESAMLSDLLQQNGIRSLVMEREAGNYLKIYTGFSVYGDDIYVDRKDFAAAAQIAEAFFQTDFPADADADPPLEEEKRFGRAFRAVIILCLIFFFLFGLGIWIFG